MYHFDHPMALHNQTRGWGNGNPSMVKAFLDYADFLFKRYGKQVRTKLWFSLQTHS